MEVVRRYGLATVITAALLFGFTGFGLGFNYTRIQDYVRARWLVPNQPAGLPEDLDYGELEEVYDTLKANFAGDLDFEKLIEGAKKGLVQATGDAYTVYLDEEAARQLQEDLEGTFSGIGAEIAVKDERLVVVAPLDGSPAATAGLLAGDQIAAIDGVSTAEMTVEEAVSRIRGEEGTTVKLTIVRGNDSPRDYTIERAVISVPVTNSALKDGGVGYIELVRFDDEAARAVVEAAQGLKNQGANRFILDLRNNPGGLLTSAVAVSDEFLDVGKTIVEERKDETVIDTFRAKGGGEFLGLPVVVLINEGSASASEIVAGALKDNQVATLVGETSFGKGSVQELVELEGKTFLKVTIARWYTPSGQNISQDGIAPDVMVELTPDDFSNNRDPQLGKALEVVRGL